MVGDTVDIAIAFFTAVVGIWFASAGFIGFLTRRLSPTLRAPYIIGGLGLLIPSGAFNEAYIIQIGGAAICVCAFLLERRQRDVVI